jgi:dihydrolipoamide dehydrogenase
MATRSVDIAIIGAGTAGMRAYRAARGHTDSLLLIEDGPYGTTCARVGCMPSKLLIAAADAAESVRKAGTFGIRARLDAVDGAAVLDRVRRERDRFVSFVVDTVEGFPAEHRLSGRARFTGPTTLAVAGDDGTETTVEAGRVVIATGSRPHWPADWTALGDRLLTSDSVFELPDLPDSVVVFGAGVIGLELGHALALLGVRTRLLSLGGDLAGLSDPEVRGPALAALREALPIDIDADIRAVERTGDRVAVRFVENGKEVTETFDYALAATGRRPNVEALDLAAAGLALDDQGLPIHDRLSTRCSEAPVFIAGDADGTRPILHEAADEGFIAGDNAGRWPEVRRRRRKHPMSVVFSEPQIALVGDGFGALCARQDHQPFACGAVSFDDQGRSRVMAVNRGALRVYGAHGTGLFLGAELAAPAGEHLAHLLAWALENRMTVDRMLEMPFYHPVIEEGLRTALRRLHHALEMGPRPVERCLDCGPGA